MGVDRSDEGEAMEVRLDEAIGTVLREGDRSMPLGWVLVVEVMGDDGRQLWTFNSPDAKPWDTLGYMMMAVHEEQAATIAARPED